MPENIELEKILFLDIETVSSVADWNALDDLGKELWEKKSKFWLKEKSEPTVDDLAETYKNKAAIYAEFGKIIVISAGFISRSSGGMQIRIKSYTGETEKQLLKEFGKMLDRHYQIPGVYVAVC